MKKETVLDISLLSVALVLAPLSVFMLFSTNPFSFNYIDIQLHDTYYVTAPFYILFLFLTVFILFIFLPKGIINKFRRRSTNGILAIGLLMLFLILLFTALVEYQILQNLKTAYLDNEFLSIKNEMASAIEKILYLVGSTMVCSLIFISFLVKKIIKKDA